MKSIYDDSSIIECIKDVKEFYLCLNIEKIQIFYDDLDLNDMEWFYSKNASYYDYFHFYNELYNIKYKVFKNKKFPSFIDAINSGFDVSGIIDNKQKIYFCGTDISSNTSLLSTTITIGDYRVNIEISKDLMKIKKIISVSKRFMLSDYKHLDVCISGNYKGERSSLILDEYIDEKKYKTISASNDEMFFNPIIHKINNEYFYEFENSVLKRIYFIGKDGKEINTYLNAKNVVK